jgi:gamma-glutamyl-gamma-aminobutyrate hydrolase PuuD
MNDERRSKLKERVDEEFAGEHGTTLSDASLEDEQHPELHPQSPAELARKLRAEAREGDGVVDKVKRGLEEMDRDISGEYERREDPTAPPADPDRRR